MKTLQEVFLLEPELVNFLQKMDFFDRRYNGHSDGILVINDPKLADEYFHQESDFGDWSDIQNSDWGDFDEPPSPEFMSESLDFVAKNIVSSEKNFHGANLVLENLQDNIISDICSIFEFDCMELPLPPVWQLIKYVYLHSGWPCGWDGVYPAGRMVVFSNDVNLK